MEKDQESKLDYSNETSPQYHDYLLTPKPQNPAQMKNNRFKKIIHMHGVFIHHISIG